MVGQALATTNEKDLLHMIRLVHMELGNLLDEFDLVQAMEIAELTPVIEIGEHRIEAVNFID